MKGPTALNSSDWTRLLKRFLFLVAACATMTLLSMGPAAEAKTKPVKFPVNFTGSLTGKTIYLSPAGMEPDFDLVYRVIIRTKIHSPGLPPLTLILDAYLENFQYDTQPVLPDLIHPTVALSSTLGGFFSGEALLIGPKNTTLYTGEMLAEALIDPRCMYLSPKTKHPPKYCLTEKQHMQVYLVGQGPAKGSTLASRSWFVGNHKLQLTSGKLYGELKASPKVLNVLKKGSGSLTSKQVLADFNVNFPRQMGTGAAQGQTGPKGLGCFVGHCINPTQSAPSQTGKHPTPGQGGRPTATTSSGGIRPTMILGFALIGVALVLLGVYFWQGHQEKLKRRATIADGDASA